MVNGVMQDNGNCPRLGSAPGRNASSDTLDAARTDIALDLHRCSIDASSKLPTQSSEEWPSRHQGNINLTHLSIGGPGTNLEFDMIMETATYLFHIFPNISTCDVPHAGQGPIFWQYVGKVVKLVKNMHNIRMVIFSEKLCKSIKLICK